MDRTALSVPHNDAIFPWSVMRLLLWIRTALRWAVVYTEGFTPCRKACSSSAQSLMALVTERMCSCG